MSRRPAATVLYEDSRGPTKEFGPHALVIACLHDIVGGDRWGIDSLVDCVPKRGSARVIAACREDAARIARDGRRVVVVLDDDHIRQALRLPPEATHDEIAGEIKRGCASPDALDIFLLVRNVETVLQAARDCGVQAEPARWQRATGTHGRKRREDRDSILAQAAWGSRGIRDCIMEKVPTFKGLVDHLAHLLKGGC